jgi:toxin ParE1/3/4
MKVTWTAKPRMRLAELYDYIAQDSKPRALAMVERLLDRSETPEFAPRSGTRLSAFVDDEMRELLERAYRIVYRISATGIEILTVKHYRQQLIDRPADFLPRAHGRTRLILLLHESAVSINHGCLSARTGRLHRRSEPPGTCHWAISEYKIKYAGTCKFSDRHRYRRRRKMLSERSDDVR